MRFLCVLQGQGHQREGVGRELPFDGAVAVDSTQVYAQRYAQKVELVVMAYGLPTAIRHTHVLQSVKHLADASLRVETKYKKLLLKGLEVATKDSIPGIQIGSGGSPLLT